MCWGACEAQLAKPHVGLLLGLALFVYFSIVVVSILQHKMQIVALGDRVNIRGGVVVPRVAGAMPDAESVDVIAVAENPQLLLAGLDRVPIVHGDNKSAVEEESFVLDQKRGGFRFVPLILRRFGQWLLADDVGNPSIDNGSWRVSEILEPKSCVERSLAVFSVTRTHPRRCMRYGDIRAFDDLVRGEREPISPRLETSDNGENERKESNDPARPSHRRIIVLFSSGLIWFGCLRLGAWRINRDRNRLAGYVYFGLGYAVLAFGLLLWCLTDFRWSWG